MPLIEKYNTDEVFLRSMLLGLVKNLSDKITYYQVDQQQNNIEVFIPFFYSMVGDESFLQDNFLSIYDCNDNAKFAEGNYDVIPRGVVKLESSSIDTASLTNKYVRGSYYIEDVYGQMKAMSSYLNPIPLICNLSVEIKIDTYLDSFKIFESVIGTFYKVFSYYFEYSGMKVPVQVGLPESYENTKQFEFTYLNSQPIKLIFPLTIETYYPQKDLSTERFRGNLMQRGIRTDVKIKTGSINSNAAPQPSISSFLPLTGASGSSVVIRGLDLLAVSSVKIGETEVSYTIDNNNQITAIIPGGTGSDLHIKVMGPAGTAVSFDTFSYNL
jgi:hypothetical protein